MLIVVRPYMHLKTEKRLTLLTLKKINAPYLSVKVFSKKVLIGDTIFYVSNWRRDRHFTWSSEPREGLAALCAKRVPAFLRPKNIDADGVFRLKAALRFATTCSKIASKIARK